MQDRKDHGLELNVSINDGGSGLIAGISKAYPEAEIQRDVFHALRDVGRDVYKIERRAYASIAEEHGLQSRAKRRRSRGKAIEKLEEVKPKTQEAIAVYDTISILFAWLRELLGFSGYSAADASLLIDFILREMERTATNFPGLLKECGKLRAILPLLLLFIGRLERGAERISREHGIPLEAFRLMYRQLSFGVASEQYNDMEYQLVMMLMEGYNAARLEFRKLLDETQKASSLVENLNSRIRVYMDIKRVVPTLFFVLMKVYFNTRRYKRSRHKERKGKSPLELLTGKNQPDFFAVLGY